jgi:hypothetical protein
MYILLNIEFFRNRLQSASFWKKDTPTTIRMRVRLFRKSEDIEREFVERRQEINRLLRAAKVRAEVKQSVVKKTKFKLQKALAGYL